MNHLLEEKAAEAKKLTYVRVYEQLYDLITDGSTFPIGSRLPSEPKLAAMLGVSRMTLRQALELLHEDGLLSKMQGKGNFVVDHSRPMAASLERLGHPVYTCTRPPITNVEIEFRIEPSSAHDREMFKRPTAVTVVADRWYRAEQGMVAYSLSMLPIETISKLEIDLNQPQRLLQLLENDIYSLATRSNLTVRLSTSGDFVADKYVMSKNAPILLLLENLYGEDDYAPLVCNKHYLLPHCSSLEINAGR